ncbi:hypothetical protein [Haloarcula nitratireducens]|uniref:DUF8186 domain-containing protein n=1 Tax=Haloarcula nitratireducens TaxID=2487749 RepID=A0AAW4PFX0_9EURY|nr:hypothetical protein [Halomicroarcula nitratireducens]MBX0296647.1 hypothetical protein [Halomicroarcula nitratireducens]
MLATHPRVGLLLVVLLILPIGSAVTTAASNTPNNATRAFIADDRDPAAGTLPPFVSSGLDTAVRAENVSVTNVSRMRDFTYATTQPPYSVGPGQQTLEAYRLAQLQSIARNDSTSLWFPESQLTNGTVVADAHITLLGTREGTRTRLNTTTQSNESDPLLIPRTGTALTYLDYTTRLPDQTCSVTGDTRTCVSYELLEQDVSRQVQIGTQTWAGNETSPRQLTYTNATATEPTTMQVSATINTTVTRETTTYTRTGGGWQAANTTSESRSFSQTVTDSTPILVTTNQQLTVTQTVVHADGQIEKVILQFEGSHSLHDRRLWSYARFEDAGRLQNVWGVYSQRQYDNATRSHRTLTEPNATVTQSLDNATLSDQSLTAAESRRQPVTAPNILELQLVAQQRWPTLHWEQNQSVTAAPTITRLEGDNLSTNAAPLDEHVNLSSVRPRSYRTVVIENTDQPITGVRDIHNDSVPLTTRTVQARNATLSTTMQNETHARIQLTDGTTGQPLPNRTLWLSGAAQSNVTTESDGTITVERRDLYVTVSFAGVTNTTQNVYYSPAETQLAFEPEPFNIYQLLTSLAGAIVSIAAFLLLFLPFVYLRQDTG